MEDFLRPIKIKIFYDENLKKITDKDFEEAIVSEGMTFANQLYFIYISFFLPIRKLKKDIHPGNWVFY